jgi:hypothetical protein
MTHLVHSGLGISSENVVFVCLLLAVFYIVGAFIAIILFQRYTRDKCGYKFFDLRKCYQAAFGLLSLCVGVLITYDVVMGKRVGELGPFPAFIIGSFLIGELAVEGIRQTNFEIGLTGVVLQVFTAPMLALGGILFLAAIIAFAASLGPVIPVIDVGAVGGGVGAMARAQRRRIAEDDDFE